MRFSILTLFPEYFNSPFSSSLLSRAIQARIIHVDFVNIRQFGRGAYHAVDDKPYGGGAGQVLSPVVLERAFLDLLKGDENVLAQLEESVQKGPVDCSSAHGTSTSLPALGLPPTRLPPVGLPYVVYLSPQGRKLNAVVARQLSSFSHIALLCGHYEGIDERIIEAFVHDEISIGDYVLTGGEPAAAVLVDTVSRFIPGVVGDALSVQGDTFENSDSKDLCAGGLKYPVYTKPALWRARAVPEVLLSGHHGQIKKWRYNQSIQRTKMKRPDLFKAEGPSGQQGPDFYKLCKDK